MYLKVLKGVLVSYIFTFLSFLIFSIILNTTNFSDSLIPGIILIISTVSILIGSTFCTINVSSQGFIWGGIVGLIYSSVLYIISSFLIIGFTPVSSTISLFIFSVLFGAIGGVIGINIKH